MQANFMFGIDTDRGAEPIELTKEFIRRLPLVWPTPNIPTPFGNTPLYEKYLAEDRILRVLPFAFYYNPYLAITLKHYDPLEYYDHNIDLRETIVDVSLWMKRLATKSRSIIRFVNGLRNFELRITLKEYRIIRNLLRTDAHFRAFHEGRSNVLPEFYNHRFEERLGRYAHLISRAERVPVFDAPKTQPASLDKSLQSVLPPYN
jgi:hypothetical protein